MDRILRERIRAKIDRTKEETIADRLVKVDQTYRKERKATTTSEMIDFFNYIAGLWGMKFNDQMDDRNPIYAHGQKIRELALREECNR